MPHFRTMTDDELLLHVDNLPDSLASPLVRELASRLRAAPETYATGFATVDLDTAPVDTDD